MPDSKKGKHSDANKSVQGFFSPTLVKNISPRLVRSKLLSKAKEFKCLGKGGGEGWLVIGDRGEAGGQAAWFHAGSLWF